MILKIFLDNAIDQNGFITDPGTIAMLKAQYNVEFEKVYYALY